MNPDVLWAWAVAHPASAVVYGAIVLAWLIANVAPRPHPEESTGWKKVFWTLVDRMSALSAQEFPGKLKLPLLPSLLVVDAPEPVSETPEPASAETERKEP